MRRFGVLLLLAGCALPPRAEVAAVLDDFHDAAAKADFERYFGHFAPGGVFLGTDATERWTVAEFKAYAEPHFRKGTGWTYRPRDRHVAFSAGGAVAWVDELLDHDSYGVLRGTAVLRASGGAWRVAHYSLTFLVPNEKAKAVVDEIRR